jgi:hypothetical protein
VFIALCRYQCLNSPSFEGVPNGRGSNLTRCNYPVASRHPFNLKGSFQYFYFRVYVSNLVLSTKLKDKVLIVGYNEYSQSVYTAFMPILQYYDGDHPWDSSTEIKKISLKTVHGYIFSDSGAVEQEFESHFNLETGFFEKGWQRDDQGIVTDV